MAEAAFSLPADVSQPTGFLHTLLTISQTAVAVLRPLFTTDGTTIRDFAWVSLNPAGQRLLTLPACPAESLLTLFPAAQAPGGDFDLYCRAYATGQALRNETAYQADGLDGYYVTVAQRYENVLVVNFTDTNEQSRSAMEEALRASQARERAANAQLLASQAELNRVLQELPVTVAVYEGPTHVLRFYNATHAELVGRPLTLGLTAAELFPELIGQPFFELPDRVYATGEPIVLAEVPLPRPHAAPGDAPPQYATVRYAPRFDAAGQVSGVLVTAVEVTDQVRARQQVEQLNQQLEARVAERTQAAEQALAEAERQRQSVVELVAQAPAALAIVSGPEFRYELFNPRYAAMFDNRPRVGLPMGELFPEIATHPAFDTLRAAYSQGRSFRQEETLAQFARPGDGVLEDRYFNYTQQPRYNSQGQVTGVFLFAVDVTAQVLARRQVEQLNAELEARVQQRTQQLEAARATTERERALLQAVFAQAPVAIALFQGPEVVVASVNERMAALWGRSSVQQALGRPLVEAVPELRGQGFDDIIRQVQATGVPYVGTEAPATLRQEDGQLVVRYYNYSCQAIYDALGQPLGVVNVGTEVTAQVAARQDLERLNEELEARVRERTAQVVEQQRQLHDVLENVPAAIATLSGPEHRFSFANARYQYLVGNRVQVGQAVAEALPEVVEQGVIELLDRVYQTGEPFIGRNVMIMLEQPPAPPHQYYYDLTYLPLRDGQGRVQGQLIFAVEVTEQVRARRQTTLLQAELLAGAQRRAQERQDLLHVFANAPLAVALLRKPDHQLDYWNALLDQYFPGAERGKPLKKVLPALATPEVVAQLDRRYQNGETYQSAPTLLPGATPGAARRYVIFTYQAYQENGQVAGVALFLQDVTEQVLGRQQVQRLNEELTTANQELQSSNARLTRTNADLDTFIYTASHDLRSPIANIEGLLAALRQELLDEPIPTHAVEHLLQLIDGSINRFNVTIGQLTNILHQQQHQGVGTERVDVADVAEGVRLDLALLLQEAGGELLVDTRACPALHATAKDLRSIVFNLLSNAVKYRSPARPLQVELRTACTAHWHELRVQDNGLGLSPEQQAKLFGLFQRLHPHIEGTGVGLYAIKKLIENAGGTIGVESEAGVGSTFLVRLPA